MPTASNHPSLPSVVHDGVFQVSSASEPTVDTNSPVAFSPSQSGTERRSHSPPNDTESTPPRGGPNVLRNSVNPPKGRSIRSSLAEKDGVRSKMQELTVEEMFKTYIPGDDPSSEMQSKFKSIAFAKIVPEDSTTGATDVQDASEGTSKTKSKTVTWVEWHCMIEIAAHSADARPLGPLFKTYDTSNWPVQPGMKSKVKRKRDEEAAAPADDDEGKRGTRPDGGVYLVNDRTEQFVTISDATLKKESKISDADKKTRTRFVGHCSWADLIVPVEVKVERSHSAFTFSDKSDHFLLDSDEGNKSLGHILEYVGRVFTHQHRTHVFALYVFRSQARILYFDRAGCIVSEPFEYGTGTDTPLHRFFWRLSHMSTEERGYDHSAQLASEDEVKGMLDYASSGAPTEFIKQQIYYALSWDLEAGKPRSTQWPAYRITMDGRTLLIARPMASSQSLHGRCTRGYIAYDTKNKTTSFLKDYWRPDSLHIQAEHGVYERLATFKVSNIATCDAHQDVPNSHNRWQVTKTHDIVDSKVRLPSGHYRILIREVCRPLIDFKEFRELASLLLDAMIAHEEAWSRAGVLHRDISINNILILEEGEGSNFTRRGILNDWDLCKYKEQMDKGMAPRRLNLTSTWYFRSALSLQFPRKPYRLSDDIESFIHVYHYCVYRFHITDDMDDLVDTIKRLYAKATVVNGIRIGGKEKLLRMENRRPPMDVGYESPTLAKCLVALHRVYNPHYLSLDIDLYQSLYRSPPSAESSGQHVIETGLRPLDTHDKLKDVFSRYGGRDKDLLGKPTIVWGEEELTKTEDLFQHTSLAEHKNAQLSSSVYGDFEDIAAKRPVKRQKIGNISTTLLSIAESQYEAMSS
ncbi:hypothetical protein EVG20_g10847 [Dentipellis fragilis]|uniref:Fungal-type protein kinase domain-containing protein n=1 Tax=Dentipellis fragilis TaxID=205917 RepID=A0A4Y9XN68_9AGAM|nr:hypothetical protein EVG20_g10847 [Dentipellis fragilis]